ncbi:hypothetical protein [Clostridiisalibacter paucivorans]|uniref:hypothetical protein n=1 Tax=Clostridiisalibacter paucivorans TaxID=408753 RepID=UPI00047B29C4|nr:hypothetical protein [Clostridiisalibacter paucivorans]
MNNINLLKYEIRRIMYNKKYFYMILILSLLTIDILMRLIISGTYNTAPFSRWSYSEFIALITPLLLVILVLLCISVFDEREMAVRKVISATLFSQIEYYFLKGISIGLVFILTALIPIIMSFIYYGVLFNYYDFTVFIKPILLFLLPPFIFVLGIAMVMGKINVKLLYFMIPVIYFSCAMNFGFPIWIDICGNNFISSHGLYLQVNFFNNGEIPYNMPLNFIYSRIILIISGIGLFLFAAKKLDRIQ